MGVKTSTPKTVTREICLSFLAFLNVQERIITMFRCDEEILYTYHVNQCLRHIYQDTTPIFVCVLILFCYNYIIIESCFT